MLSHPDNIAKFIEHIQINGGSPNTVRAYRADLNGFYAQCSFPPVDKIGELEPHMAAYLTNGKAHWSINTLNRKLACFRKFGQFFGRPDFLAGYKRPNSPPGIAHPIPEGIDGVLAMIDAAKKPHHKALITFTGLLGLRVAEALSVRLGDLSWSSEEITVLGKGEKTRIVPVSDHAWGCLSHRIIEMRQECLYVHKLPEMLFVPLADRVARRAITSIAKKAGLSNPVSSHDLRMTFGTVAYYNSGGDIRAVQELLGHASSHTTENYTSVSMDAMRAAADITRR